MANFFSYCFLYIPISTKELSYFVYKLSRNSADTCIWTIQMADIFEL